MAKLVTPTDDAADSRRRFDDLYSEVYEQLRRIAACARQMESHSTLGATALVHEVWLRMQGSPHLAHTSPEHFKNIAARVIRRVLVDAARERKAGIRGGPDAVRVTLDEFSKGVEDSTLELLQVDESLNQLAELDPEQAHLAELKIFSELTNPEIAAELGVSLSTVERDWRIAKAWLKAQVTRQR